MVLGVGHNSFLTQYNWRESCSLVDEIDPRATQILIFKFYPSSFFIFHHVEESDNFSKQPRIYQSTLISAVAINLVTKVYSIWLTHKITTLNRDKPNENEGIDIKMTAHKFALSLNVVSGIGLLFLWLRYSLIADRYVNLYIVVPMNLTLISVFVPLVVVLRNKKMKTILFNNFLVKSLLKLREKLNQTRNNIHPSLQTITE